MDFILIDGDAEQLHFPVNPSEVQFTGEIRVVTVPVMKLGEVDVPSGMKPISIAWESFFPAMYDPTYCRVQDLLSPTQYWSRLRDWQQRQVPVQLLITESPINKQVIVSRLIQHYKGGHVGDIWYSIELRQYIQVKVYTDDEYKRLQKPPSSQSRQEKPVPLTVTVKKGDSLWSISKRHLGTGSRWREIYELNKSVIGPDPNFIKPGTTIKLPQR